VQPLKKGGRLLSFSWSVDNPNWRRIRISQLNWLINFSAWVLIVILVHDYFTANLTLNPIQAAMQRTGKYALVYLLLSLSCSPLKTVFGLQDLIKLRRGLGLYAFLFAALHGLMFIGWDYGFDFSLLKNEFLQKRYVIVGSLAFLILFLLAITSFPWWMKRMGTNWKRLHQLVYLAGGLVIVHYGWAKKGDFFRLQGDIWQPLLFGIIFLMLVFFRIPPIRKFFNEKLANIRTSTSSVNS
jgi:methionine sulfoxide reductase heme-binding subunit